MSPYELFYDLVFIGAILGLSLSFGRTTGAAGLVVAAATFLFAWWIWQETMLFSNWFGDPLAPLPGDPDRRALRLSFAIRATCLFQMVLIVLLALDEPEGLVPTRSTPASPGSRPGPWPRSWRSGSWGRGSGPSWPARFGAGGSGCSSRSG